jgi:HCOMODA/2-hydroxy-3-carboxy-muconic semialdehyde decarboxylase
LDSDLLLIALTALASFPWFVRPLTLLVTEQSPESPEFLARWDAFLLGMGRALVGAEPDAEAADARQGGNPGAAAPHRHRELRMLGRGLDRAGLTGPFGHCSLRVDADTFLVTPPHPLRVLGTRPCVVVPVHGPLPGGVLQEVRLDQAVYRARPDVGAIAAIAPASVDALALAGRSIAACDPHAAYFGAGPVRHDGPESPADAAGAAVLAASLGAGAALVRPGGGAVVVGETSARALALALFLDQAAVAALRREPAAPAAPPQVASWADRRAERVWEYATAGDPEAVARA